MFSDKSFDHHPTLVSVISSALYPSLFTSKMAALVVRSLLRKNILKLNYSSLFCRNTRVLKRRSVYPSCSIISKRLYASESHGDGQQKVQVGTIFTQGPFGWLSKKINLFLLKAYFDPEFDENEFLRGARQALVVTSEIIAEKRFDDLSKICPQELIDVIKKTANSQDLGPAIKPEEILVAKVKTIELGYREDKTKQIEIVVIFACVPKDLEQDSQVVGNVKIIYARSRSIIEYRFRKLCVPGQDSWYIIGIDL